MEEMAVFGTPLDGDLAARAGYNWDKRPTIFFGYSDMQMIERHLQNYFGMGEGYEEILFARGLERVKGQGEQADMDMEFNDRFGVEE
jgi:hypothetical protein